MSVSRIALLGAAICAASSAASAQTTMKFTSFLPPVHQMQEDVLAMWAREVESKSGGSLKIEMFAGAQLGPPPKQYELVRNGVADFGFVLHSATPGVFPLTEVAHLPYVFPNATVATWALNDLRPDFLDAEHKGVRIQYLLAHAPGLISTREKPITKADDVKGLRIRHPSPGAGAILETLGATPVGVPPGGVVEAVTKGTVDGTLFPYDGLWGFRLGEAVKHTTEMQNYVSTFAVVMNPRSYERLTAEQKALIDELAKVYERNVVGQAWDQAEVRGKKYMLESGVKVISLDKAGEDSFRAALAPLTEKRLAEMEAKGLPAREVHKRLQDRVARYSGK